MKSIEIITSEIALLEGHRDFGNITPEGEEMLIVLNFCYDLLSRTKQAVATQVPQPEEMKEPGFEDEFIQQYGITASDMADFVFSLTTNQANISFRKLLSGLLAQAKHSPLKLSQRKISKETGIAESNLSNYCNNKAGITADNLEKAINYILQNISRCTASGKKKDKISNNTNF